MGQSVRGLGATARLPGLAGAVVGAAKVPPLLVRACQVEQGDAGKRQPAYCRWNYPSTFGSRLLQRRIHCGPTLGRELADIVERLLAIFVLFI